MDRRNDYNNQKQLGTLSQMDQINVKLSSRFTKRKGKKLKSEEAKLATETQTATQFLVYRHAFSYKSTEQQIFM